MGKDHARAVRNNKTEKQRGGGGGGGEWMKGGEGYTVFTNAIRPEDLPVLNTRGRRAKP